MMLQGETQALKIFYYFIRRWRTEESFKAYQHTPLSFCLHVDEGSLSKKRKVSAKAEQNFSGRKAAKKDCFGFNYVHESAC